MALRNIRNYHEEDTILRKISKEVKVIDEKILTLLNDMANTMYQANGAGLAAPQIGILKRLIVIDVGDRVIKLINPVMIEESGEQQGIEGCLSVPDISGEVLRPQKVRIKAQDEKGEYFEMEGISLEIFENIAFVMAKHAEPNIPDSQEEWLDEFNTFSIYQVLPK